MAASDMEVARMEDALFSEGDIGDMRVTRRSFRFWASVLAPLLGAAAIVVAIVATRSPEVGAKSTIMKEEIVVHKPVAMCSKGSEDCSSTKCCQISGHTCYEKKPGTYGCLETCDPAKGYTCKSRILPLAEVKRHSDLAAKFYCFSVYTKNTGSTNKSYELELLQEQYKKQVSIFSCDYYDVFSDADAMIGPDYPTTKVEDVNDEFFMVKREETGTWVNTGMFKQVWKAMSGTKVSLADWVVKVDADAVFVPHRLKAMLMGHPLTYTGIYIENCKEVMWGYFGNLEVFSDQAFKALLDNIDSCSEKIDWVKGGIFGPIGEDLFAQMCMDYQGVSKVQNFDLTTDAMCPGTKKRWGAKNITKWKPPCNLVGTPAMHPFKKPKEYFTCLEETLAFA